MRHIANESGRTMLEMLGVLAIMGVIMYGAIAGIGFGVESYKINATYNMIEDLSQGIVDLYSWSRSYSSRAGGKTMTEVVCENDVVECDSVPNIKSQWGGSGVNVMPTADGANFIITLNQLSSLACSRLRDMTYSEVKVAMTADDGTGGVGTTTCDVESESNTLVLISR